MQLQLTPTGDDNVVQSVDQNSIWVGGNELTASLILGPRHLDPGWPIDAVEHLTEAHAWSLLELQPELVILGTGKRLRFPHRAFSLAFATNAVGCEVMDTFAACRTYNVLVAEGRNVFAALIIDPADSVEDLPARR